MLFEGPEKKLEVLLAPAAPPLRGLGPTFWEGVVAAAEAEILSQLSSPECDAYLLSESSLFVWDDRLLMITCGRTTLAVAAERILRQVGTGAALASVIYERKNENFPHLQRSSFDDDVVRLRALVAGATEVFGDADGDHIALFHLDRAWQPDADDTTLELLMHGIPDDVGGLFVPGRNDAPELRRRSGLADLFGDLAVDDHIFAPQGYSYNALGGSTYATLHVTPQRIGSYVSFETNRQLDAAGQRAVVARLLEAFRPARAELLIFQRSLALDPDEAGAVTGGLTVTHRTGRVLSCGYAVEYAHLQREPRVERSTS
ncbi:MAG: adenosylmethionine decarboxylase [Candidatus Krumholzibacteriia bacterium]